MNLLFNCVRSRFLLLLRLSAKQGGNGFHLNSLWYDPTRDGTPKPTSLRALFFWRAVNSSIHLSVPPPNCKK